MARSSARRRAKGVRQRTKRCATGAGWRNKASGVTAGGGGPAAAIWRAFAYARPECAAPAPTRPSGGDQTTRTCSCCLCHARCWAWTRLALWRAGVSAGRPAARRAAACRVLRAPHTGGPAGALRPTLCCTRAESYNTPAAAGVCVRVRGHARLVAVRRRLRPLAGGPGRPPGAQRLARALGARSRRARAGSAQSYNMPGWRVAVGGRRARAVKCG